MAFNFTAVQWESNAAADKTLNDLFATSKREIRQKSKAASKRKKGHIDEREDKSQMGNNKIIKKKAHKEKQYPNKGKKYGEKKLVQTSDLEVATKSINKDNIPKLKKKKFIVRNHNVEEIDKKEQSKVPLNMDLITKQEREPQNEKSTKPNLKHKKNESRLKIQNIYSMTRKQKFKMPLRERMMQKLKAARFRYLNEQMYTKAGNDSKKYFEQNPEEFNAYHQGYKQQVLRWPLNPLDTIIDKINKMPKNYIIADFGCGEGRLAKSVQQKVHSFDLVAVDSSVTACDMCNIPLKNDSVDVAVFCLSLMGTNLKDYLSEATRVLKIGGLLKIAEVESRFDNIDIFIQNIQKFGFTKAGKDLSHDLFWFLDFVRKDVKTPKFPEIHLNPCLYKKR